MSRIEISHILELPAAERVAIVQEIWESMLEKPENIGLTAAQGEELERRWIDLQQKPHDGESWADVKNSLLKE